MQTGRRLPVTFVRGTGCLVYDEAGREYLDMVAGIAVNLLGHSHPDVLAALGKQAAALIHTSNLYFTQPQVELARRLVELAFPSRVFLCNSGAEANEAAIKLARKARPAGDVVVAHGAFHGRTYGALSATPQESKQAAFAPLVPGFRVVEPSAAALSEAVDERTAAVLLEPIQGETGVNVLAEDALHAARATCDEHGAALIFDEVQCGMGRTGTLWAYERTGVVPDAITAAKALGGGLPIGALITGERLADVFSPGDHGSTFAGGPVIAAAALEALALTDDRELLARVGELGLRLAAGLERLAHVRAVRGRGLMLACDLDVPAPEVVRRALLEQRLVVNATGPGTLRLLPALIVEEDEIDDALMRLRAALEASDG
jgi:predicted acetylornithine/succinylornithine family transaminase